MRESENYRDVLEDVRAKADSLFPGKVIYTGPEIARLLGRDRSSIYRMGFTSGMTAAEIARTLCRRRV